MAPLTGDELIAKVDSMPGASKTELCTATGYVREKNGKTERQFARFYRAVLAAKGQRLDGGRSGDGARSLSYQTAVLSHGGVLIGARYVEQLGLKHGDHAVIQIKGGVMKLTARKPE
jgi:hypothetical protein